MPPTPANTVALIVGIESYDTGAKPLKGPASDALRFVRWLRARGVPDANLLVYVSPVSENEKLLAEFGVPVLPATQANLLDALEKRLPLCKGDTLFFAWGGHGAVTDRRERRLFFADATATSKRNLNFNDLLDVWRTDIYQQFNRVIAFIDTCANYLFNIETSLPNITLAHGQMSGLQEQSVLFAASHGEYAKNDSLAETGFFSRELLHLLEKSPMDIWPPDMAIIEKEVHARFKALQEENKTGQTPISFHYLLETEDAPAREGVTIYEDTTPLALPAPSRTYDELEQTHKKRLWLAFLACDVISNNQRRDTVVNHLPLEIRFAISRSLTPLEDVAEIVRVCANYPGGIAALTGVIEVREGNSIPAQRLRQTINELLPGHLSTQR